MALNFYNCVYLPVLSWLVAMAVIFIGHLLILEYKHLRRKFRLHSQRQQLGPQGVAIPVRGLGPRSEASAGFAPASKNWTVSSQKMDTAHKSVLTLSTERQISVKPAAPATGTSELDWASKMGILGSTGRG